VTFIRWWWKIYKQLLLLQCC